MTNCVQNPIIEGCCHSIDNFRNLAHHWSWTCRPKMSEQGWGPRCRSLNSVQAVAPRSFCNLLAQTPSIAPWIKVFVCSLTHTPQTSSGSLPLAANSWVWSTIHCIPESVFACQDKTSIHPVILLEPNPFKCWKRVELPIHIQQNIVLIVCHCLEWWPPSCTSAKGW